MEHIGRDGIALRANHVRKEQILSHVLVCWHVRRTLPDLHRLWPLVRDLLFQAGGADLIGVHLSSSKFFILFAPQAIPIISKLP